MVMRPTVLFDPEQMKQQSAGLRQILGIGITAFIIAAIGIANTMYMSIYERTREIGIIKVIGARLKDIRRIFLMEAGWIGIFGGVFGIGLSLLASMALNRFNINLGGQIMWMPQGEGMPSSCTCLAYGRAGSPPGKPACRGAL